MCSTPKRTGTLFRAARIKEDNAGYASMLRRASERMDRIQCERETQQDREQADKPRPVPESSRAPVQDNPELSCLSRLWDYLNTPHYLFR